MMALVGVLAIVEQQANDEGLWFVAQTAPEGYLQQELRRLHAAIEVALERKFMSDLHDNTADDLIRRGDVVDALQRIAGDHEDLALFGETEQARIREGMAAALRRAQYAVAFMPPGNRAPD